MNNKYCSYLDFLQNVQTKLVKISHILYGFFSIKSQSYAKISLNSKWLTFEIQI